MKVQTASLLVLSILLGCASVDGSFRVLYGSFEIDITKRILSLTKITQTGVFVKKASLPKGKHKLPMVVEDTSSRKGNRVIEFVVQ